MKNQLLTWLISLVCYSLCQGQNNEQIQFLDSYFSNSEKLTYGKGISEFEFKNILKTTAKDTLAPARYRYALIDNRLILTKEDHRKIDNQLDSLMLNKWYEHLHLANSQALSEDSIKVIFEANNFKGWEYFRDRYGLKLYHFSKPILFRDNTLCLFYCGYSCGSLCGEGSLMVFKKEQGNWVKWLTLYTWVS